MTNVLLHGKRSHTVRPGETLSGIARHFGVDMHVVARLNHIHNPNHLRSGTLLQIDGQTNPVPHRTPPPAPLLPAFPTGPIARPQGGARLGDLSMRYETGFNPGQEARAAAVVSGGVGDPGGVSYGAYQLTSSAAGSRQVQGFLRADGAAWAGQFAGQNPETAGGDFGRTWQQIATRQPAQFFEAQHAYIERTHYTPVVNFVQQATTLDIGRRSRVVQNVIWSMSVQHGRAAQLAAAAVELVGPQGSRSDQAFDTALVNQLYDTRLAYVEGQHVGTLHPIHMSPQNIGSFRRRYASERQDALRELGHQQ